MSSSMQIFINYRRGDTQHVAGRLDKDLVAQFGEENVFIDVRSIEPGAVFAEVIERAGASSDVLISLIGDDWLTATDESGRRRLDNPADLVRHEIKTALASELRVIPILVDGAQVPRADELPDEIRALAGRSALELSHPGWDSDVMRLIETLAGVGGRPIPWPVPATPLVGRQRELSEVVALLQRPEVRLLTLTGAPGTGKTRLALELGSLLLEEFRGQVFFVDLSSIADPVLALPAIAQTLAVEEVERKPLLGALKEALRARELVLVLDNFEHVVEAAPEVAELLSAAPGLRVIVTSRTVLNLSAEHEYPVEPLAEADAVEFFRQRARAAKRDYMLDERVSEICDRLDRLPLALELAAARVKVLSSAELLERLDERLSLLTGGARDLPQHQRTLRATLEWSYELLEKDEQLLFARLAVFVGGCTHAAATQVCSAEIDGLGSLVDKSLLRVRDGRFEMLETIRAYAAEQLKGSGEAEEIAQRHAAYIRELLEEIEPELVSSADVETLAKAAAERSNVLAALERAEPETRLRIAGAFWRYWLLRGHLTEGRSRLEDALAAAPDALSLARAKAERGAGILAHRQGDYQRAWEYLEASLRAYDEVGDTAQVARASSNLGNIAVDQGAYEEAGQLFDRAAALAGEVGDNYVVAGALSNAADMAETLGDYPRAEKLARRSLVLLREIGDEQTIAVALQNLGSSVLRQGRPNEAHPSLLESLEISHRIGAAETVAYALESLGELEAARCERELAARLLDLAQRLRDDLELSMRPSEATMHDQLIASLAEASAEGPLAEVVTESHGPDLDETVAAVLSTGSVQARSCKRPV
jgi:predicted ATPase